MMHAAHRAGHAGRSGTARWDVGRWATPYGAAIVAVALCTGLVAVLRLWLAGTNLTILYLLPVLGLASVWGRGPAILAAVLGFLVYDFAFVPPLYTFTIRDPAEWVALVVFLFTALVAGQLAAALRRRAEEARAREAAGVLLLGQLALTQEQRAREARARAELTTTLYELTRALIAARPLPELLALVAEQVVATFGVRACAILLPDEGGRLRVRACAPPGEAPLPPGRNEEALARWTFDRPRAATATRYGAALFLPLEAGPRRVGLMCVTRREEVALDDEHQRLLSTFAAGAALAIERAALADAALRAAVLARSDELKTALLSSVSHELRTPLAAIKGSVSSLLEEGAAGGVHWDEATRRDFLATIDEETDRLTRLVGSLLDMSRIEAGALRPRREPYALDELLWSAIDRLSALAGRVRFAPPPDLPLVPLDPVLLDRALGNLLDNAAKYAPPGTPVDVTIETYADRGEVWVRVSDHGPGVPPADRERIFERFYRAGRPRGAAPVIGFGLGLAIARGFVEAHDGRLWVEDAPGGGASFIVALPLAGRAAASAGDGAAAGRP
ncbi:MAG TPA: DUF4118 domain-containing protein [Thermomicrobiales bacterium]|nr:DUF4118 domain-containing protein [Thermomicrobiales bacterium]